MGRQQARRLSYEALVFAIVLTGCVTTGSQAVNPVCAIRFPPVITAEEAKVIPKRVKVWMAGVKNALIANECRR